MKVHGGKGESRRHGPVELRTRETGSSPSSFMDLGQWLVLKSLCVLICKMEMLITSLLPSVAGGGLSQVSMCGSKSAQQRRGFLFPYHYSDYFLLFWEGVSHSGVFYYFDLSGRRRARQDEKLGVCLSLQVVQTQCPDTREGSGKGGLGRG